jgi:hypothetical protein
VAQQLRKEIQRLVQIEVHEEYNSSDWVSFFPTFAIPMKNLIEEQ